MELPTKQYAQKIFRLLRSHYSNAKMILNWGNNWELLVAIILSAQCTDKKVNEVTAKLFPKYRQNAVILGKREALTPESRQTKEEIQEITNFASIPLEELAKDIKPTGFYRDKAKNIQTAAKMILEKFQGGLPNTMEELLRIPGVGRKTANVFLGNAYHINEGIAVDTHVKKQSQVLGLTKNTNPDKIEQDLIKLFPKGQWFPLTYLLIEHGRNVRKKLKDRLLCEDKGCILCKINN